MVANGNDKVGNYQVGIGYSIPQVAEGLVRHSLKNLGIKIG